MSPHRITAAKEKVRWSQLRRPSQYLGSAYGTIFAIFCCHRPQKCSVSCNSYEKAAEARVRCMSLLRITVEVSFQPGNITLILIST